MGRLSGGSHTTLPISRRELDCLSRMGAIRGLWLLALFGVALTACSTTQATTMLPSMPPTTATTTMGPRESGAAIPRRTKVPSPGATFPSIRSQAFAEADGLMLERPAAKVDAYAYHESLFKTAVEMTPLGRAAVIDTSAFIRLKPTSGPRYIVMASRNRGTGPTTAVDVVLPPGETIYSPVSGVVVDASEYRLYCRVPDHRVIIRPDASPNHRVVLFHLVDVHVRKGDVLIAGRSPVGRPHVFTPHNAQYDNYVRGDRPHVHIEVETFPSRPLPGCPVKE